MFQAESAGEAPPPRGERPWWRPVALGLVVTALAGLGIGALWLGGLFGSVSWFHAPWEDNRRSPLSSLLDFTLAEPVRPTPPPTAVAATPPATSAALIAPTSEATSTPTEVPPIATPPTPSPTWTPAPRPVEQPTAPPAQPDRPRQRLAQPRQLVEPTATATSAAPVVIAPGPTPLLAPPAATATATPILLRPGQLRAAAATATAHALATPVRPRRLGTP
jgi:hypothetical protein